ncbi:MAG: Yae1 family protein [Pyrinomonadaceae bacterium]
MGLLQDIGGGLGKLIEEGIGCFLTIVGILLLVAFVLGCIAGYKMGGEVGRQIGYSEGKKDGLELGKIAGYNEGYPKGKEAGFEEGKSFGGDNGYLQGYEDKTYGNPNKLETTEKAKLGERRNQAKSTFLYISALLAVLFILYWLPFIYFKNPKTGESSFENFDNKSFQYAAIAKVLLSITSIVVAWNFLSSDFLAQTSLRYFNNLSIETVDQFVLIATGILFSILLILLIEYTTFGNSNPTIKFWAQIIGAAVFPLILYLFIGTLVATHIASTDSTVKMLLLQAGITVGLVSFLTVRYYKLYLEHKSQVI